jgi:hypothetical protein
MPQIKCYGALTRVVIEEIQAFLWMDLIIIERPARSHPISTRRFNFYYISAEVGQEFTAIDTFLVRQVQNPIRRQKSRLPDFFLRQSFVSPVQRPLANLGGSFRDVMDELP